MKQKSGVQSEVDFRYKCVPSKKNLDRILIELTGKIMLSC